MTNREADPSAFRRGAEATVESARTNLLARIAELTKQMEKQPELNRWEKLYERKKEAEYIIAVCLDSRALPLPEAPPVRDDAPGWHDGAPPRPWSEEGFIAKTIHGDRVVLKALPEDFTYDFTTADETYIKTGNIKQWMQFPDSHYLKPDKPRDDATAASEALRVAREALEAMLAEWDKMTRYGSPLAKSANENVRRAREALAAIDALAKGGA